MIGVDAARVRRCNSLMAQVSSEGSVEFDADSGMLTVKLCNLSGGKISVRAFHSGDFLVVGPGGVTAEYFIFAPFHIPKVIKLRQNESVEHCINIRENFVFPLAGRYLVYVRYDSTCWPRLLKEAPAVDAVIFDAGPLVMNVTAAEVTPPEPNFLDTKKFIAYWQQYWRTPWWAFWRRW